MTGHLFDVRLWPWLESCQSLQPRVQRQYRAKHVRWTNFGVSFAARLLDPRLYEDRVADPADFYQRIAQHVETLRVVREYPFFGVGFGLYYDVVSQDPLHTAKWKGMESMALPHNVLMTVLSEEGLVGWLFYVSAQVFLIRAMWRIRKVYPPGWLAFLYCVLYLYVDRPGFSHRLLF
jgi:O-antigen ligase